MPDPKSRGFDFIAEPNELQKSIIDKLRSSLPEVPVHFSFRCDPTLPPIQRPGMTVPRLEEEDATS